MAPGLRPIRKTDMATTLSPRTGRPIRRECWGALTADGEWGFERIEDTGTPWVVEYHPGQLDAERCIGYYGTLQAARAAAERGTVRRPSLLAVAHVRGEHQARAEFGCPTCEDAAMARMRVVAVEARRP